MTRYRMEPARRQNAIGKPIINRMTKLDTNAARAINHL